jgi:hypothetical protein
MDIIFQTIKNAVVNAIGKDIDYSKSYEMVAIVFNPITQTITGQCTNSKLGIIVEAKVYSLNPIKLFFVPPGCPYLLSFIDADPSKPYVLGFDMSFPGIIAKATLAADPSATTPLTASGGALITQST